MKIERMDLIPVEPLLELSRVYGKGAEKYDDNNYRRGYEWSKSYGALLRHITAFWGGEDIDPELGTSHLMNAAWHCFTLFTFIEEHPEFDNRYNTLRKKRELEGLLSLKDSTQPISENTWPENWPDLDDDPEVRDALQRVLVTGLESGLIVENDLIKDNVVSISTAATRRPADWIDEDL